MTILEEIGQTEDEKDYYFESFSIVKENVSSLYPLYGSII